jgi:hypothetical protein
MLMITTVVAKLLMITRTEAIITDNPAASAGLAALGWLVGIGISAAGTPPSKPAGKPAVTKDK